MRQIELNFTYWLLQTIAMMVTALLLPKLKVTGPLGAFGAVVALALVNAFIWDTALFFQLPDTFTVRTLLLLITNGVIFWIVVKVVPGIEVEGLLTAILAPVIFTICSVLISIFLKDVDWGMVLNEILQIFRELRAYFKGEPAPVTAPITGRS